MVLEIWEGGNPPNLADSLGIESVGLNSVEPNALCIIGGVYIYMRLYARSKHQIW